MIALPLAGLFCFTFEPFLFTLVIPVKSLNHKIMKEIIRLWMEEYNACRYAMEKLDYNDTIDEFIDDLSEEDIMFLLGHGGARIAAAVSDEVIFSLLESVARSFSLQAKNPELHEHVLNSLEDENALGELKEEVYEAYIACERVDSGLSWIPYILCGGWDDNTDAHVPIRRLFQIGTILNDTDLLEHNESELRIATDLVRDFLKENLKPIVKSLKLGSDEG